jgi:hypothetical protein
MTKSGLDLELHLEALESDEFVTFKDNKRQREKLRFSVSVFLIGSIFQFMLKRRQLS